MTWCLNCWNENARHHAALLLTMRVNSSWAPWCLKSPQFNSIFNHLFELTRHWWSNLLALCEENQSMDAGFDSPHKGPTISKAFLYMMLLCVPSRGSAGAVACEEMNWLVCMTWMQYGQFRKLLIVFTPSYHSHKEIWRILYYINEFQIL